MYITQSSQSRHEVSRKSQPRVEQLLKVRRTQASNGVPARRSDEPNRLVGPAREVVALSDVMEHVRERVRVQLHVRALVDPRHRQ